MDNFFETQSVSDSKALNFLKHPAIIIAASGMATGGRVVHHLARLLPDSKNTVVLVGFQAHGTRGRSLLNGAPSVKMHGGYVAVAAQIVYLPGLSVHADQKELLSWLFDSGAQAKEIFLVHGEVDAISAFKQVIAQRFDGTVHNPEHNSKYSL